MLARPRPGPRRGSAGGSARSGSPGTGREVDSPRGVARSERREFLGFAPEHLSEVLDGGGHLTRPAEGATAEESELGVLRIRLQEDVQVLEQRLDPVPRPGGPGEALRAPRLEEFAGRREGSGGGIGLRGGLPFPARRSPFDGRPGRRRRRGAGPDDARRSDGLLGRVVRILREAEERSRRDRDGEPEDGERRDGGRRDGERPASPPRARRPLRSRGRLSRRRRDRSQLRRVQSTRPSPGVRRGTPRCRRPGRPPRRTSRPSLARWPARRSPRPLRAPAGFAAASARGLRRSAAGGSSGDWSRRSAASR